MNAWTGGGDATLPVVISYFTDPWYRREAWDLARSCQANEVAYEIHDLGDRGGWLANTNAKPSVLLEAASRHAGRALLWLDADARVRRKPVLFRTLEGQVAWRTWHGRPASGTVFLPVGPSRIPLLAKWVEEVAKNPKLTDQVCMGMAAQAVGITHVELPWQYCSIYDIDPLTGRKTENPEPSTIHVAVIEHLQASRWRRT